MRTFSNLVAIGCLIMSTIEAFVGDYAHAAFLMGLACFNRLNAMEAA